MKISKNTFLNEKALAFLAMLNSTNFQDLALSDYNRFYLERYLEKPKYNLYLICQILEQGGELNKYDKIIDLGGGIGFNTAFIKFLGLDVELIYIDIDKKSTDSAKVLHQHVNLLASSYYSGDLASIETLITDRTLICSRDVLEHIYDLPGFFRISSKAGKNIHNTSAIKNHFLKSSSFKRIHKQAEYFGNKNSVSKERDHRKPYFELRKLIIKDLYAEFNGTDIKVKSKETRGLIVSDIRTVIKTIFE